MNEALDIPQPYENTVLFGQASAEAEFCRARACGRLNHAWLIEGPRGVGKATLAWRIARSLIAHGVVWPDGLDVPEDHPVSRRIRALNEPNATLIKRTVDPKTGRESRDITVAEIRQLRSSLLLAPSGNRPRVIVIDSADEMNENAANAVLKILEEPQNNVFFLLISHSSAALLPTIRSRCCRLRCVELPPELLRKAIANAGRDPEAFDGIQEFAHGSVGEALHLVEGTGVAMLGELKGLMQQLPQVDHAKVAALASSYSKSVEDFALLLRLILNMVRMLALAGLQGIPERKSKAPQLQGVSALVAPGAWADLYCSLAALADDAKLVNLDPTAVLLDIFLAIENMFTSRKSENG